jgi:diamine N-acetyltransferase
MLQGKNIRLRALEPQDADLLYNWENDESIWLLSNTITPFSKFVIEQYVMNSHNDIFTAKQLRLMIDKKGENEETVGSIDIFDFDPVNRRAGIGILIRKPDRRKGYAKEAISILIKYCFSILNLHQLYCNISAENPVSLKLFQQAGFSVIGLKKEWIFSNDNWIDEYILQLIRK